jgi:hypothetical protein
MKTCVLLVLSLLAVVTAVGGFALRVLFGYAT